MFHSRVVTATAYRGRGASPLERFRLVRASGAWHAAADLVWICWEAVLESTPETRSKTFAGYLSALAAEEAAADSLAQLHHPSHAL